jgi:hypothetical protein
MSASLIYLLMDSLWRHGLWPAFCLFGTWPVARATAWHVEELVFSHPDCCRENELLAATLLPMFYLLQLLIMYHNRY